MAPDGRQAGRRRRPVPPEGWRIYWELAHRPQGAGTAGSGRSPYPGLSDAAR